MKTFRENVLNIAHRGASGHAPENTMAAIERAFTLGADGVEFDIQLTKDGHPILFHDDTLMRTTNGKGKVTNITFENIARLDAGSWFAPEFMGERVPHLDDVLDFAKGKLLLNIEIKTTPHPRVVVEKVVQSIVRFNIVEQCLITSFDIEAVRWTMQLLPDCLCGILCKKMSDRLWQGEWDVVALKSNLINADVMQNVNFYNKLLLVWTANEEQELSKLYETGARRIITNFPDRYKKVIEKDEKNIDW